MVLLALKVCVGNESTGRDTKVQIMPTWTDNRGNGSALNKMMTTRHLAVFMKRHGLKALVEWTPREANREADELAKGVVHGFALSLEVKIQPKQLSWHVLLEMLDVGAKAEEAHHRAVKRGTLPNRTQKQKKRKPEERQRVRDPW